MTVTAGAGADVRAGTGPMIGRALPRKEDARLLTGTARFLADIKLPGTLYARVLRSPHAHARIQSIDTEAAGNCPGVHAVLTGRDIAGKVQYWGHQTQGTERGERFPFAVDKVLYEGQEVAAVVADSEYAARDAVEAIEVTYEELPVVMDLGRAMADGAPVVIEGVNYDFRQGNAYHHYRARVGDMEAARENAAATVAARFATARPHGAALEAHGCVADYDPRTGRLTVYSSTQGTYLVRDLLAQVLGLPINRVRVVAVEVGAGFGSKADLFPHEVIASLFALKLGRPVQLILSRADVFRATTARCNQVRESELQVAADGEIIGWRERILHNAGGGSMWANQVLPLGTHIGLSCYPIPNVHIDGYAIHTNSVPGGALRGFGVPQTVWAVEQLADMAAYAIGMDPAQLRLRNVLRDEQCPYRTPLGHVIDSTSISQCIEAAVEASGWAEHRRNPAPGEGIGIAVALKHTSCRHPAIDTDMSSVRIRVESDGTVLLYSSDVPHGQGHATMLSQIVADSLGVSYERITVQSGDTDSSLFGLGTWGSRGAAVLGAAAQRSAELVREKLLSLAAHLMECGKDDLDIHDDQVMVRGDPAASISVAELAACAAYTTHRLPPGFEPGSIEASATYDTPTEIMTADGTGNITATYSGVANVIRVRVDPDTGVWKIVDYWIAADSGTVVNPLIVEGQHQGAVLHGLGWLMGESLVYDERGHLLTPSFASYLAPYATELPDLSHIREIPAPSRVIPGGRKGAGESDTSVAAPAVANAIFHATGVRFTEMPLTPDRVFAGLQEKARQGVASLVFPGDRQSGR
ncbi:MAG: xanthine dehydrogenase family protein molybdopterin-binding subunit [Streptosporangiaceae bacterium]